MFEPEGHVWCEKEFKYTDFPDSNPHYKETLAGTLVEVMEISRQEDEYLVLGRPKKGDPFLWQVDKRDTYGPLLPIVKKHGMVMPAGMDPIEEFAFIAKMINKGVL